LVTGRSILPSPVTNPALARAAVPESLPVPSRKVMVPPTWFSTAVPMVFKVLLTKMPPPV